MNNILSRFRALVVVSIGALVLYSCNIDGIPDLENTYLPEYNGGIALLLVNDTITIKDFLEGAITDTSKYGITENQQVIFSYAIESDFALGDKFVSVQDFSNRKYIESPIQGAFTAIIDTSFVISSRVPFNFPASKGEQLDSMYFLDADFVMEFNSGYPSRVDLEFSTAAFTNRASGDSIYISSSVDPNGAPPGIDTQSISMAGYKTNLTSEADSNQFFVNLEARIFLKAGDVLTGNEYINVDLDIRNPQFDVVFGAFGQDTFNIQEKKVSLDFFSDLGGEGIVFQSPRIEFTFSNGFGIPVSLDFSEVYAGYDGKDPLKFSGSFPNTPQLVNASPVEEFGTSAVTTLVVDENNSNLRDLLSGSPKELVLPLIGYSNLDGVQPNWIDDESSIEINAKVSIPLSIQIDGFRYDELFEMGDLSSLENTKEVALLFNTVSELPFDGVLDLYFLDENEVALDSITGTVLLKTPTVFDANGKVLEPSENRTEIVLDEELINALTTAIDMRMVLRLDSYNASQGEFVELFADYQLQIKIGVAGDLSVDLNGN